MTKTVSIVIPCRNEENFIGKCIDSFMVQSYPKELLTVVVADGMSTDNTRDIIEKHKEKYGNIILVDNIEFTAPKGMNKGIKATNSDIVIIFGAHSFADKDFVLENVKALENEEIACCGGPIETINDSDKGAAIGLAMSCPFGVGNALFRFADKETFVDTVAFGAYRREVLDEIGLFDEELTRNQDDELNMRVTKANKKILLTPKVKSTYYSRASFKKLWKQYFQYGFWKVRVIQKHKKPAAIRHLIPLLFVLYLIGGSVLSLFFKPIRILFFGILALYLLLDICFAVKISRNQKLKCIPYIIITFPLLHISYGLGFILGIWNFYIVKSKNIVKNNTDMSR
ncbi:MAG: glycosyltransferase family 2 protein [Clostridium sp.]|uniref:glycosyltransferase family 2 protein n=1 Tax=Clostridium sp. TaxID=1506 RepID=UPI00304C304D